MNLDSPDIAPLANWCIDALLTGEPLAYSDVPASFECSEALFSQVMDEIVLLLNGGNPSQVH